jgi:hypothetical protein
MGRTLLLTRLGDAETATDRYCDARARHPSTKAVFPDLVKSRRSKDRGLVNAHVTGGVRVDVIARRFHAMPSSQIGLYAALITISEKTFIFIVSSREIFKGDF